MNLKQRFSLLFSFLFSVLLTLVMFTVYYLFSNFREVEFRDRLAEKAETTVKLLLEVKEVDYQTLKIIDRNSINRLYNEKTLVFNNNMQLIYSSIDDAQVNWSKQELEQIKENKQIFKRSKEYDVLALHYVFKGDDYYILISAEDRYGNTKLRYLKYLLLGASIISVTLVWLLSFYLSKKSLEPLDSVRKKILEITDQNLQKRLPEPAENDEIGALAKSFNQMMDRIDGAYQRQKEFTGNASHELRNPIAKILAQLENVLENDEVPENIKKSLQSIAEDTSQLSEIVTSLLLLSEINNRENLTAFAEVRLDEIIFNSAARISKTHPDFKLQFEIESNTAEDIRLEIKGEDTLLQIAFTNLLRNAYMYSEDKLIKCRLSQKESGLEIVMSNTGPTPDVDDTSVLFNIFTRGSNTSDKAGSGIGLSIVNRILQYHGARIVYTIPGANINQLSVSIPYNL